MTESQLVRQILDYCNLRKLVFWRNQSGVVPINDPKYGRRMVKMGAKGSPDIIGCYKGYFVGAEAKVGKNKPTETQLQFAMKIALAGGYCKTVYSLDDFMMLLVQIDTDIKEKQSL